MRRPAATAATRLPASAAPTATTVAAVSATGVPPTSTEEANTRTDNQPPSRPSGVASAISIAGSTKPKLSVASGGRPRSLANAISLPLASTASAITWNNTSQASTANCSDTSRVDRSTSRWSALAADSTWSTPVLNELPTPASIRKSASLATSSRSRPTSANRTRSAAIG